VTNASAIHAIARDLGATTAESTRAELEADLAAAHQSTDEADSPDPLNGYRVIEVLLGEDSHAIGKSLDAVAWPPGHIPVSVLHRRVLHEADPSLKLTSGDRVNLLVRQVGPRSRDEAILAMDNVQGD
jgi:CIC family chloride channel protein